MDNHFMDEVRRDLAALRQDTTDIKITLGKHEVVLDRNTANLNEHMRRTAILEGFTARWAGAWTVLGVVGTIAGIAAALFKIVEFFR